MTTLASEQSLSKVQAEIEGLLAARPDDDFRPPVGYRSLVLLESVLLGTARESRVSDGLQIPGRAQELEKGVGGGRSPVCCRRHDTDRPDHRRI